MKPQKGTPVKRHEFRAMDAPQGTFTVFEGAEDTPFWNREDDGIRFVFTNLTYAVALKFTEDGVVTHTVVECDGSEFERYREEAQHQHDEMATPKTRR